VQFYIARLQKFSDVLTAENKNVFSFAAKVQTVQFNIRMDFCGAEEKNGGRGTDSPGGRHPNRTNGNPTPTTSASFYRPDALPAAQPNMEAHFELWVWQSGRRCDRTGASEPPLWLTADAMVSVRVVSLSHWQNQRPLTRQ